MDTKRFRKEHEAYLLYISMYWPASLAFAASDSLKNRYTLPNPSVELLQSFLGMRCIHVAILVEYWCNVSLS